MQQYSKLSKLKVLFYIPKRGRGSNEVVSSITLYSNTLIEPENFIEPLIKFQKKVLNKDTLYEIGTAFIEKLKLDNFHLQINFLLPIDKLSPTWEESFCFYLNCTYYYEYNNDLSNPKVNISVECPIRINYISVLEGQLFLKIENSLKHLYFEDVLDIIQKYGNVVIYPITKASDKQHLLEEIDDGKSIEDYLTFIKDAFYFGKLSETGEVKITVSDLYNNYQIEKGISW